MIYLWYVPDGQILDMKDARVETALEMELLMERVPESIRFSKVSRFVNLVRSTSPHVAPLLVCGKPFFTRPNLWMSLV